MSELSPDAQDILHKARAAFSPSDAELLAVRTALKSEIAASIHVSPSSPSPAAGLGARAFGAAGWSAGHSAVVAVAIGAIGVGALAMHQLMARPSNLGAASTELAAQHEPTTASAADLGEPATVEQAELSAPSAPEQVPMDTLPTSNGVASSPARAPARPRTKADPSPTTPAATTDSLAEEVRMLREARSALDRGDAAAALRLLDAHEARFRRATLQEERLASRVQALCALGSIDRARVVARELERTAPRSPHLARVRASCIAGSPSH